VWRREVDEGEDSCVARFWGRRPNATEDTVVLEIPDVPCNEGFCFDWCHALGMKVEIYPVRTSWWITGMSKWG